MNGTARRVTEDLLAATAGVGIGAGLMYLFDPRRGRSRRSRLMGEARGILHRGEHRLANRRKDLVNRLEGLGVRVADAVAPEAPPSDETLLERIRARMGHVISHPHEVEVHVEDGVVFLEGKLGHLERRRLTQEVRGMEGVRELNTNLRGRKIVSPALLLGLGAGLALFGKGKPAAPKANAA
ncbi:MAG TPA: BON domain-containing protein [Bryobacteraceae bacterium]|nr:BON domain-containing protein [Bryobacteraceae bacterium]